MTSTCHHETGADRSPPTVTAATDNSPSVGYPATSDVTRSTALQSAAPGRSIVLCRGQRGSPVPLSPNSIMETLRQSPPTFSVACHGLESIGASQKGLSRTCHGLRRKHLDMLKWSETFRWHHRFVFSVRDFHWNFPLVKVGLMEFGLSGRFLDCLAYWLALSCGTIMCPSSVCRFYSKV